MSETPIENAPTEETAPKRRGRKPGSVNAGAQGKRQSEAIKKIETMLDGVFGGAAALTMMSGNPTLVKDSAAIIQYKSGIVKSLCVLCEQDKYVREFLLSLTTGSAYAGVALSVLPLIIAILANHNLIPPLFGSITKEAETVIPNVNGTETPVYSQG